MGYRPIATQVCVCVCIYEAKVNDIKETNSSEKQQRFMLTC